METRKLLLGLLLLAPLSLLACNGGEGERCNPSRVSDECNSGLSCTTPQGCAISVCCPPPEKLDARSPAECLACANRDAGTDMDAGDASTD